MSDMPLLRKLLQVGGSSYGLTIPERAIDLFHTYLGELQTWNAKINLSAITDVEEIILKHFLDSLIVLKYVPLGGAVLDIGSGGGFPGLPLKILQPDISLCLVEASRKKANFLRHMVRTLALSEAEVFHGRIEAYTREKHFDFALCRAFSETGRFLSLAAPFLKEGGLFVAMKGRLIEGEGADLEQQNNVFFVGAYQFELPQKMGARHLLVFRNVSRETCASGA